MTLCGEPVYNGMAVKVMQPLTCESCAERSKAGAQTRFSAPEEAVASLTEASPEQQPLAPQKQYAANMGSVIRALTRSRANGQLLHDSEWRAYEEAIASGRYKDPICGLCCSFQLSKIAKASFFHRSAVQCHTFIMWQARSALAACHNALQMVPRQGCNTDLATVEDGDNGLFCYHPHEYGSLAVP